MPLPSVQTVTGNYTMAPTRPNCCASTRGPQLTGAAFSTPARLRLPCAADAVEGFVGAEDEGAVHGGGGGEDFAGVRSEVAASGVALYRPPMSNREIVINLIEKLPEDMPLQDIAREIELIAGVRQAREEAARGEGV